MVGDRLDTDVALAHAMGASSLLVPAPLIEPRGMLNMCTCASHACTHAQVLTGVANAEDVLASAAGAAEGALAGGSPMPTHAISHVGRLLELTREQQ